MALTKVAERLRAFTSASEHISALRPLVNVQVRLEGCHHPCGMHPRFGYFSCYFRLWLTRFLSVGLCPGVYAETLLYLATNFGSGDDVNLKCTLWNLNIYIIFFLVCFFFVSLLQSAMILKVVLLGEIGYYSSLLSSLL